MTNEITNYNKPEIFITADERCGGTALNQIVRLLMYVPAIDDPFSDNWLTRDDEPELPCTHAPAGDPAQCLELVYRNAGCIKHCSTLWPESSYRPLLKAVAQRGCRVVLLWRENALQRAISLALAKKTRIYGNYDWTTEPRQSDYSTIRVTLDIDEIAQLVDTYTQRTADVRYMLKEFAPEFLEIRYEDLFSTTKTIDEKLVLLEELCKICSVDPEMLTEQREKLALVLSPSQKMNTPKLYRNMITNINDIAEVIDPHLRESLWDNY